MLLPIIGVVATRTCWRRFVTFTHIRYGFCLPCCCLALLHAQLWGRVWMLIVAIVGLLLPIMRVVVTRICWGFITFTPTRRMLRLSCCGLSLPTQLWGPVCDLSIAVVVILLPVKRVIVTHTCWGSFVTFTFTLFNLRLACCCFALLLGELRRSFSVLVGVLAISRALPVDS
jgi:hypothetical protein